MKKSRKIGTRKLLLVHKKYGAHVVIVNAHREIDPHSFRRYLRMSSDVYEVRMVTRSEYN